VQYCFTDTDTNSQHFFLQHLPSIPHLRSLSIPFFYGHAHPNLDPRELALQIVDIVALRPEVEICYMGIANKCFEILENRRPSMLLDPYSDRPESHLDMHHPGHEDDEGIVEEEQIDEEVEQDEEEDAETESEDDDDEDEESDDEDGTVSRKGPRLRLREILFYDDKVAIFKARHGKL
jgi:hypothetical protein